MIAAELIAKLQKVNPLAEISLCIAVEDGPATIYFEVDEVYVSKDGRKVVIETEFLSAERYAEEGSVGYSSAWEAVEL